MAPTDLIILSIFLLILFVAELTYFRIADYFLIVDRPNQRSSHRVSVIRGGGIIFVLALFIADIWGGFRQPYFSVGVFVIAGISFIDDVRPQSAKVRFFCHIVAIVFLLFQIGFFDYNIYWLLLVTVIAVGTINAFNFMDGINGMTGLYSLVNFLTFIFVNEFRVAFISNDILVAVLGAVVVFLTFNFRKRARCFAGDVGSITLAYVQIFLVLHLVLVTSNVAWVLMFTVYGIDAGMTLIHRLLKKENIFQAHRTHLYQYLANEIGLSHRRVSLIYSVIQLTINVTVILFVDTEFVLFGAILTSLSALYIVCRCHIILRLRRNENH